MEPSRPAAAAAPPRQRWRLVYRRRADAPPLPQRDQIAAWEAAVLVSGLPFAGLDADPPRPRLVFAAPLAVGIAGERELVDLYLTRLVPVAEVRARLAGSMPAGHEAVDLYDVWLGDPALPGQVVAADYVVSVVTADGRIADAGALQAAAARLLAARSLPRTRVKGDRRVGYDLRPLIDRISVLGASQGPASAVDLLIRTRFQAERGVGRPEEVVAALVEAARLDVDVEIARLVRAQLILAGEQPAG